MQSAELRELTASEELTLEQEYAMQREPFWSLSPDPNRGPDGELRRSTGSWQEDEDSACRSSHLSSSFHFFHIARTYVHYPRASAGANAERGRAHKRRY